VSGASTMTSSKTFSYSPYYWCGTVDSDWNNVNNWYTTSSCSVNTLNVPGSSNEAYLTGSVSPIINSSSTILPLHIDTTGLTGIANTAGVVFSGTSLNTTRVTGNITYTSATAGTMSLSGSMQWAGTVSGTIKGNDGIDITNLIFNNSSTNETTIGNNINTVFNDLASNNGTIQGDATYNGIAFRIGTVNGTATMSGVAQTVQGVSNVFNFVKQALTRDVLYIQQGSILNISGLATILGKDDNTLLSVKSTSADTNANININGTLNANFLRLKNISNSGLSQNVSTQTIFDDGSNSGFVFRSNATPSSRGSVTSSYTPPALPPSRGGVVPATTPSASNVTTSRSQSFSGTVDSFFTKTIAPILFKDIQRVDLFKNTNSSKFENIGNTVIPKIFQDLNTSNPVNFTTIPTNFLRNITKFVLNKDNVLELFTVKINNKTVSTSIKHDKTTNTVTQDMSAQINQKVDIKLNTKKDLLNGTFNQKDITINNGNVSITTPSIPGTYYLKVDNSNVTLTIQVTEPVKLYEVKKTSIWNWFKKLWK
jgi:hypothetical protein